ncbi:MAG: exodeoxyribonuclease VII large subunit [Alphaproteobacteria bacterium]|nr:exodeoxyribonuclease VII large subunit [Alphaproteobacteria bacterium]
MSDAITSHNLTEYSVSEISGAIKRVVEDAFGRVRLRGELSGYRGPHSSGHCYFTVKDEKAAISAVMWRGSFQKLAFKPEDGLEVVATGRVTTYPGRSNYQIVIEHMEPAGAGALMALLEKRKQALAAEGLFDPARKQLLPFMPQVIGVVTSPTGAVIRDILHRLRDRFPCHVVVWPVAVQGEDAAEQIAAAIRGFNAGGNYPVPDLLIVARGGGSIEDLWAFNEEVVVRAAAESQIPLISAVGHETDTTLIDYASDCRAPTPTAAAEMAVPVREEWRLAIQEYSQRLARASHRNLQQRADALAYYARALPRLPLLTEQATQRLDEWSERLGNAMPKLLTFKSRILQTLRFSPAVLTQGVKRHNKELIRLHEQCQNAYSRLLKDKARRVAEQSRMLETLNYERVLERGFALIRDENTNQPITSAASITAGQSLVVELKDGKKLVKAVGSKDSNLHQQGDLF